MGEKTQDDKETQDDGKDVDPTAAESAPKEIDPQDVAQVLTLHAERMDGMFESLSAHRTELDDLAAKANTMLTLANIRVEQVAGEVNTLRMKLKGMI